MKTALITGAAQGVGRATALEFARLGYQTVIVDFKEPDLLDLVSLKAKWLSSMC